MEPGKFGPFLRDLRTRRGLTQEQVAEALHVSGAAVSKWKTGVHLDKDTTPIPR
mgnify:CR=1 FL=1